MVPRKGNMVVGIFKDERELSVFSRGGREVEYTREKGKSVICNS